MVKRGMYLIIEVICVFLLIGCGGKKTANRSNVTPIAEKYYLSQTSVIDSDMVTQIQEGPQNQYYNRITYTENTARYSIVSCNIADTTERVIYEKTMDKDSLLVLRFTFYMFNQSQSNYRVEMIKYSDGTKDGSTALLEQAIRRGEIDLLIPGYEIGFESLSYYGWIEDLKPYMDMDPAFNSEDYFTNI